MNITYPEKVDFIIAGMQKAGTSALHEYLSIHPQLIPPEIAKELQFFSGQYSRGVDWYHGQFPKKNYSNHKCYESCPDYTWHYNNLIRLAAYKEQYSKNLKLILLLREPVSRAYSQWNMTRLYIKTINDPLDPVTIKMKKYAPDAYKLYKKIGELPSFEDCYFGFRKKLDQIGEVTDLEQLCKHHITSIPEQFFFRGIYSLQIAAAFKLLGKQNILVLESLLLKSDTINCLKKITEFIEADSFRWPHSKIGVTHHVLKYQASLDKTLHEKVRDFYLPYNKMLFELIDTEYSW